MDILLWRHAEAEDGLDDMNRALTVKGQKQARIMAAWIRQHGPKDLSVLASPARRTRETAEHLAKPHCVDSLGPSASCAEVVNIIRERPTPLDSSQDAALILVGHQPTLGQVAAYLMTGNPMPWVITKGALWWICASLSSHAGSTARLKAVIQPKFLANEAKTVR